MIKNWVQGHTIGSANSQSEHPIMAVEYCVEGIKEDNIALPVLDFLLHLFDSCQDFRNVCYSPFFIESFVSFLFIDSKLSPSFKCIDQNEPEGSAVIERTSDDEYCRQIHRLLLRIVDKSIQQKYGKAFMTIIHNILRSTPIGCSEDDFYVYHDQMLCSIASLVIAKEYLDSRENTILNLGLLANLLVDKVYQLLFPSGSFLSVSFSFSILKKIFKNSKLLESTKKKDVETLYKAINRGLYYLLENPASDESMEQTLKIILENQRFLFHPQNSTRKNFLSCLCYQLLKHLLHDNPTIRLHTINLFKIIMITCPDFMNGLLLTNKIDGEIVDLKHGGFDRLLIKETHSFSFWVGDNMQIITKLFDSVLSKVWFAHVHSEEQAKTEGLKQLRMFRDKQQINSEKIVQNEIIFISQIEATHSEDTSNILKTEKQRKKREELCWRLLRSNIQKQWRRLCKNLYSQRALYGPDLPGLFEKWKLDQTEGPYRMRKKVTRNLRFYNTYPTIVEDADNLQEVNVISQDPKIPASEDTKHFLSSSDSSCYLHPDLSALEESEKGKEKEDVEGEEAVVVEGKKEQIEEDHTDMLSILLPGVILNVFNSSLVSAMDLKDGLFVMRKKGLSFIENFHKTQDGRIIELYSNHYHPSSILPFANPVPEITIKNWNYKDIEEVLRRRYLLRPVGMELFYKNGTNQFWVLGINDREKIYKDLCEITGHHGVTGEFLSGAKTKDTEDEKWSFSNWRTRSATEKWCNGEISNFQYLMYLNTLAGRSFSDLSQYHVFPWVLSDYTSETLDLNDPKVYRDLSLPMGALCPARAAKFKERYDNWDAYEQDGVPPWHYGTHYSSAGIVGLFLIRLEPFSSHFVKLQNGKFDVPDRLFHSLEEAWNSASGQGDNFSLTDVRELTPEFFYLPYIFTNNNKFVFGDKHTGEKIWDVVLPPWAHNDPNTFVLLHREALESEYVSAHLNEWIDLIFGYKQKGKEAEDVLNVFYYLTYEGAVDIDSVSDILQREAILSQIDNYGQTPKQLFSKPHPKRSISLTTSTTFDPTIWLPETITGGNGNAVGQLHIVSTKRVLILGLKRVCIPPKYKKFVDWHFTDGSLRIVCYDTGKVELVKDSTVYWGKLKVCSISEDGHIMALGGSDCVVHVMDISKHHGTFSVEYKVSLIGHDDLITALAVSRSYSIIVSGSKDGSCIIWDINRLVFVHSLPHPDKIPVEAVKIDPVTGDIIAGHGVYMLIWSVNAELLINHRTDPDPENLITTISLFHQGLASWSERSIIYITAHKNGTIKFWKPMENSIYKLQLFHELHMYNNIAVTSISLFPDGEGLFGGDEHGNVVVWTRPEMEADRKLNVVDPKAKLRFIKEELTMLRKEFSSS